MEQLQQIINEINKDTDNFEKYDKYKQVYDLLKKIIVNESRDFHECNFEFCTFLTKLMTLIKDDHPAKEISLKVFQLVISYQLCEHFDRKELCKNIFESLKHHGSEISDEFLCEHLKILLQLNKDVFVSVAKNYLLVLKEFFTTFFKEKYNCNSELKKKVLFLLELILLETDNLGIKEVDKFFPISILHEFVIPLIIDSDGELRSTAIKAVKAASYRYTTAMHTKSSHWEALKYSFIREYANVITGFLSERNSDWYRIWCCVVRILGTELHKGAVLVNCLLKIEETAFKSSVKDIRQQAFLCWQALVENFALDINELCSSKRMKLLLIPLQANNCRTASIALTKFNVWWSLTLAVQSQVSKRIEEVLIPFLNFCFGSFSSQVHDSTELTVKPGRRYKSLMPYVVDTFIQIIGHQKSDCDCICITKVRLDAPILSEEIFKHISKIIFDSAVEATLCTLTFEKDPSKIVTCIWASVLNFTVRRSTTNPNILNSICPTFEKLAKSLSESHSDHRGVVLCTAFETVLKIDFLIDKKFHIINLLTTFFKNASNISFEQTSLNKIIESFSSPISLLIVQDMINVFTEYFDNSECETTFNVWLLVTRIINKNFDVFEEESILNMLVVPLSKNYFQFVVNDWETLFKLSFNKFDNVFNHIIDRMNNNEKSFNDVDITFVYKSIYDGIITMKPYEKYIDDYINFSKILFKYDSSQKLTIGKDFIHILKGIENYAQYWKTNSDKIIGFISTLLKFQRYSDVCEIFKNIIEIIEFTNENDTIAKLIEEVFKYTNSEIEVMLISIMENIKKKQIVVNSEVEQLLKSTLKNYKEKVQIVEKAAKIKLNEMQVFEKLLEKKKDLKLSKHEMKTDLKDVGKNLDSTLDFENMPQLEKIEGTKILKPVESMPELIRMPNLENVKKMDCLKNQIDLKENLSENISNKSGKSKSEISLVQNSVKKLLDNSGQKNIILGHNLDTGSPVKMRGSTLTFSSPAVSSRTKSILKMSSSKTETKQKTPMKEHEQKQTSNAEVDQKTYIIFKTDYIPDWEKMTTVQREKTWRKRDDIPPLYQDLTQSNSMDIFTSNECKNNEEIDLKCNESLSENEINPQESKKQEENESLQKSNIITEVTSADVSNEMVPSEKDELKRVDPIRFRVNGNDVDIIRSEKNIKHVPVTVSKRIKNNSKPKELQSSMKKSSSMSRKKRGRKKRTDSSKPVTSKERALINSKKRELKRIQIDFVQSMIDFPKARTRLRSQGKTSQNKHGSTNSDLIENTHSRNSDNLKLKNRLRHTRGNSKNKTESENQETNEDNEVSIAIINLMHKRMSEELSQNSDISTIAQQEKDIVDADTESVPDDFQVDDTLQDKFTLKNNNSEDLFGTQQNSNNVLFASNVISSPEVADADGKSTEEFLNNTLEISPIKNNEDDNMKYENNTVPSIESQKNGNSEILSSISLLSPKQSRRNEKIMNLAKKMNASETKEVSLPVPEIIEIKSINGDRHSETDFEENIHAFKLDLLEFEKQLPSPLARPEVSIIKRKRSSENDEMMPAPKKKRVSFHDPPISSQVEYLPENFPKQLRSSKTARLPKKRKGFIRKLSTRNGVIKLSGKSVDTVVIDGDDAVDYNIKSDTSKSNATSDVPNLNFSLEDLSDVSLVNSTPIESHVSDSSELDSSQNSVDSKILDRNKPLYSPLVSCQDDIKNIFVELVDPMWTQGLQNLLSENHIETIGDLASLTAAEIRSFPLLKEKRTVKVMRKYEKLRQRTRDKDIKKAGIDNICIVDLDSEEQNIGPSSTTPKSSKTDLNCIEPNNLNDKLNLTVSKLARTDIVKDLAPSFEICDVETHTEDNLEKPSPIMNSSVKLPKDVLLQSEITRLINVFGKEKLYTALGTTFHLQHLRMQKTWPEIIEDIIQEAGFDSIVDSFCQISESATVSRVDALLESVFPKVPGIKNIVEKYHNKSQNNELTDDKGIDPYNKLLQAAKKVPSHIVDNIITMTENISQYMQSHNKI